MATTTGPCPGCHVLLDIEQGPTHEYVITSPGCWALFNETMLDNGYRLLTDAYMAQHPDGVERRQRQSVAVHLITLHAVLVSGQPEARASRISSEAVQVGRRMGDYRRLSRPESWQSGPGPPSTLSILDNAHNPRYVKC